MFPCIDPKSPLDSLLTSRYHSEGGERYACSSERLYNRRSAISCKHARHPKPLVD